MTFNSSIIKRFLKLKIATVVCITVSVAAFATLGDGHKKKGTPAPQKKTAVLSSKTFTLRTGYDYKSNHILEIAPDKKFIMINTNATFQKGNATYVLPLKKKVLLDKIKFNPAR